MDDGKEPAVEAPLGDFFGAGFGLRKEINSQPMMVEGGDGYNCYFPMPFYKRGLITVTNESAKNVRQPEYYMAGQKNQEFDLYSKTLAVKDHYLGSFKLKPGKHTLRFECVGRNPLSKGNYFGLDSVRLRERWLKKRKLLG